MNAETMTDDDRWAAVLRRDRALDGRFVTGVLTTGIYCRPSCAARHPLRENVRFFADGTAARETGLRPCKRCLPDDVARDEGAVLAAIQAIKASAEPLALADLAARTGYSPTHFQRVFTRPTGLSPAAFARALMAERAAEALALAKGVHRDYDGQRDHLGVRGACRDYRRFDHDRLHRQRRARIGWLFLLEARRYDCGDLGCRVGRVRCAL